MDSTSQVQPLRVYKIWMPSHPQPCIYHTIYKVSVKSDVKKRTKMKVRYQTPAKISLAYSLNSISICLFTQGIRNRLQWLNTTELDRQRAHSTLRSPEVAVFAQMAMGDQHKESEAIVSRNSQTAWYFLVPIFQ